MHQSTMEHHSYWYAPEEGSMDVPHSSSSSTCRSTITYQLDSFTGLFAQLSLLAQVAALARERGKTLFIEDKFWNRGKWTDHFEDIRITQPGPEPGCTPPPSKELVACPRLAKHWVINSRTAKFHLGPAFENEYHDPYAHGVERLYPLFKWAGESLSVAIIPISENRALIWQARQILENGPYLSVHLRRGDHKPMSWKFHDHTVPLDDYVHGIQNAYSKVQNSYSNPVNVWVASDSVFAAEELDRMLPSNFRTLSLSKSNVNSLMTLSPSQPYNQSIWNELPLEARISETRGVIIDFAMLSGAWGEGAEYFPESMVCTMTSSICTLAAVPQGWNRSFEEHRWVEIDNAGSIEPLWRAYTLF